MSEKIEVTKAFVVITAPFKFHSIRKNYKFKIKTKLLFAFVMLNLCKCEIVINKCCEKGSAFEKALKCAKIPEGIHLEEFYWFPFSSIVDGKTLKIHKFQQESYMRILKKATINFGAKPDCRKEDMDLIGFSEKKPNFNFLLFDDSHMTVYISANKTLQNPSHAHRFLTLEKEEEKGKQENGRDNLEIDVEVNEAPPSRQFSLTNVCIDVLLNADLHLLVVCPCKSIPCVRKCCKDEEFYNATDDTCSPLGKLSKKIQKWRPKI